MVPDALLGVGGERGTGRRAKTTQLCLREVSLLGSRAQSEEGSHESAR